MVETWKAVVGFEGLCAADVSRMRSMFSTMTNGQIAAAFGVTPGCVGLIRKGHTWSHVA